MKQTITAPSDRAVRVTIYEPAQRADQAEVFVDEFELLAGESKDYDFKSATAAYRTTPLTVRDPEEERLSMGDQLNKQVEVMNREDEERLKEVGNRRGAFMEQTNAEVDAGKKALRAHESATGGTRRSSARSEAAEPKGTERTQATGRQARKERQHSTRKETKAERKEARQERQQAKREAEAKAPDATA